MRKKELKLVVTFNTTADAMAMEKECKKVGAQGGTGQTDSGAKSNLGRLWTCLGSTA